MGCEYRDVRNCWRCLEVKNEVTELDGGVAVINFREVEFSFLV